MDTAYANNHQKRQSTTGFVSTYCGGETIYQSKTQTFTALSSIEVEFLAAVSCAKVTLYLRSILAELGFPYYGPTKVYKDITSIIMITNLQVLTERA